MAVIAEISVPSDQFALGRLFDEHPDVAVELERIVPLQVDTIPLFWIAGAAPEEVEPTMRDDPLTAEVRLLTEQEGRSLFEVRWDQTVNGLVQSLAESDAEVLRAEGAADRWTFRLLFENRAKLADFRDRCRANGVQVHLNALSNPTLPGDEEDGLTSEQYEIIATAYERGFWEIPRGTTIGELADLVGISSNAASQRMRRGLDKLVGRALEDE